jgi:hypothetical protein
MGNATTIEGAIVALLTADAGTTALVADRIYPFAAPQQVAFPRLTYQRVGTDRSSEVGAFTNDGPTGLAIARLQFDAFADSLLTAKQVIAAVRRALNGYAGTNAGVRIACMYIEDERELPAVLYAGQNKPLQRYMAMIRVSFTDI